jgi:hypothetical protein
MMWLVAVVLVLVAGIAAAGLVWDQRVEGWSWSEVTEWLERNL